ncbi:helix-turn-helix transcriptional regulator [Roseospira marina]|uniref:Helix-turn-helix transcriptional regulator n=1 Tax=Roseospira marina TaxID=140057 RepID=A0A5M6I7D4_9PROT|nr:S24 family peptidase [Roseospira marina]KAA5603745.1 helix-turn-helix transcriptional regulator [Roseospira marina]MBB4316065.1 phage repressor protein C with HTH and peptisase S24 domain [Roseospira marina]MBB5089217.1 phage repressor protein C with HTH and peptisase S24 domain [Roseospira marina]
MHEADYGPSDQPSSGRDLALATRFSLGVKRLGSQKAAATALGISLSQLKRYLAGQQEPPLSVLRALAQGADIDPAWLFTGLSRSGSDFVGVPRYDARLAAGGGAWNERAQLLDHIPFTPAFIAKKLGRSNSQGLLIIDVHGDSMEPTIGDGDIVMVDTHDRREMDGIFAFVQGDTARLKRLRWSVSNIQIISDNRAVYDPETIDRSVFYHEVQIIGRVRWLGCVV